MERLKLVPDEICSGRGNDNDGDIKPSKLGGTGRGQGNAMNFLGCPSSWYGASTLQCFFLSANLLFQKKILHPSLKS